MAQAMAGAKAIDAPPARGPVCAALDLGTNNCRLLIASPTASGFRILDAFSRIVRLGEGLSLTGRLSEAAMQRALDALQICADKIRKRGATRVRAVATQACRAAANGEDFLAEAARRTGLTLTTITPREEAQLAVAGCLDLVDPAAKAALIIDVGGGSTELSWIDLRQVSLPPPGRRRTARPTPLAAWHSIPIGVVTLAERFPEVPGDTAWLRAMVDEVKAQIAAFEGANELKALFERGEAHLVGTSGAITSLAGVHLGLPRYDRSRVDGIWLSRGDCEAAAQRLASLSLEERARHACIGPDRADLVLAGAAILQAVQELWPSERVRVADRGLREGLLLSMMPPPARRRRRRGPRPAAAA